MWCKTRWTTEQLYSKDALPNATNSIPASDFYKQSRIFLFYSFTTLSMDPIRLLTRNVNFLRPCHEWHVFLTFFEISRNRRWFVAILFAEGHMKTGEDPFKNAEFLEKILMLSHWGSSIHEFKACWYYDINNSDINLSILHLIVFSNTKVN